MWLENRGPFGHLDSAKLFLGPPPMPVGEKKWNCFFRRQDTFFKGLRAAIQNWPKKNIFFRTKKKFFWPPDSAKLFLGFPRLWPVGKKKWIFFFDVKTRFLKGSAPLFKIGQKKYYFFFRTKKFFLGIRILLSYFWASPAYGP